MGLGKIMSTVSSIGSKINTITNLSGNITGGISQIQSKIEGGVSNADGVINSLTSGVSLGGGMPSIPDVGSFIPSMDDLGGIVNTIKSDGLNGIMNMDLTSLIPGTDELLSGLGSELNLPTDVTELMNQNGLDMNNMVNTDQMISELQSSMPDVDIQSMMGDIQMPGIDSLF